METLIIFAPVIAGMSVVWLSLILSSVITSFFERLFDVNQYEDMIDKW